MSFYYNRNRFKTHKQLQQQKSMNKIDWNRSCGNLYNRARFGIRVWTCESVPWLGSIVPVLIDFCSWHLKNSKKSLFLLNSFYHDVSLSTIRDWQFCFSYESLFHKKHVFIGVHQLTRSHISVTSWCPCAADCALLDWRLSCWCLRDIDISIVEWHQTHRCQTVLWWVTDCWRINRIIHQALTHHQHTP